MTLLAQLTAIVAIALPTPLPDDRLDFFERSVRPLLISECHRCHGPAKERGGLRLDHIRTILSGGDNGPAIVARRPDESRLINAIRYDDVALQMPPSGKLSDAQIATLTRWVELGAPWPDEPLPAESSQPPPFDLAKRRAEHWAWQPITRVVPPADPFFVASNLVSTLDPARPGMNASDAIDRFVRSALVPLGLTPSREAEKRELARRLSFDLTGLPPDPTRVQGFVEDSSPHAYEELVDDLLASPAYPERWTRHWLDLFRYAETYGHEFDYPVPDAWRYRDYLIRALDADVPYDQLVREHLAGDLLPEPRRNPIDQTNESIVATAQWFFNQQTHGPVDVRQDEADRIDNQIDVMSKAFLGMTVACARCHDHKFDAISTSDYYALAGVLKSSRRQEAFLDPDRAIAKRVAELDATGAAFQTDLRRKLTGSKGEPSRRLARYIELALKTTPPTGEGREIDAHDLTLSGVTGGSIRNQDMRAFGAARWQGDRHLWWTGGNVGDRVSFVFDATEEGSRELSVALTKARDYGIVQASLDGIDVGDPIDLFDPTVAPTGPLSLGTHRLERGSHTLSFTLVGANPKAVPARMFGIDYITLRDSSARESYDRRLDELARRQFLDPTRLRRWIDLLHTPTDDATNPLFPLIALAASGTDHNFKPTLEKTVATLNRALHEAEASQAGSTLFADFNRGFDGWYVSGDAFGDHPSAPGAFLWTGEKLDVTVDRAAHSGLLAPGLQGAMRSASFVIDHDFIDYRLAGVGGQIRLIIDGYFMDVYNALLFDGMSFDVNTGGETTWHHQRVSKYRGHRAHIELLDHGDGYLAVDEIRFRDASAAPPRDAAPIARNLSLLTDPAPRSLGGVGEEVARRIGSARTSLAASHPSVDLPLWRSLLHHPLLLLDDRTVEQSLALSRERVAEVPSPIRVIAIQDGDGEDEHVFIRGEHRNLGEVVARRSLEALDGTAPIRAAGSGRLELAERFLDDSNPLTSRVAVNRVWQHLIGRGIVPTPDNLGILGEAPTHPELLDWLADWFRHDARWSLRALIKQIVMSKTYRQSSALRDPAVEKLDPNNRSLHRMNPRRLEGEALRDAMLSVAGELDPTRFGPPIPVHLTPFMGGRGRPGESGPLDGNRRRTLYLEVRRNFLSPMMLAFDAPIPHSTVGSRSVSNVPAQGLILLNNPLVAELARRWGNRVVDEGTSHSDATLIASMFRVAFARDPSHDELDLLVHYLESYDAPRSRKERFADLGHALFNLKEFSFIP